MRYELADGQGGPRLTLHDQLTFGDRAAFDALIQKALAGAPTRVTVDMSGLDYMDSAGLGMLLTLRDQADRARAEIVLVRPQAEIMELLVLACFDSLFTIETA